MLPWPSNSQPQSPAILDTRGYLLHLQGEHEKALPDLDAAVPGMEDQLTQIKDRPEELQRSILSADIDESGINSPEQGVAVVRYHRALVLKALGREKDAQVDLDRAENSSAANRMRNCSRRAGTRGSLLPLPAA